MEIISLKREHPNNTLPLYLICSGSAVSSSTLAKCQKSEIMGS